MIGIINYRAGNLQNLKNGFDFIGIKTEVLDTPDNIYSMKKLVLPGVGAFGHAVENLHKHGFWEPLKEMVTKGIPLLGICVGMQLLFDRSLEGGTNEGLGFIPGEVRRLESQFKIPHMGWNTVTQKGNDSLCGKIPDESWFYFVHSYVCHPRDEKHSIGVTDYGQKFTSMVSHNNIWGVQFHPEKSQSPGLQLLKNFSEL